MSGDDGAKYRRMRRRLEKSNSDAGASTLLSAVLTDPDEQPVAAAAS